MKNVAVSLMAIFFAACSGNKSPHSLQQEKEDLSAKGLLQGIWLDDETESPLMRVEGDTIYYADVQSTPIAFKIIRDTLYTYGNDTTYYKIDKQAEHIFWFHSITDDVIKLHKSEDANDSIYFVRQELVIPAYTEVTKRDSVVTYNGTRYRAYVYINPSKMRVIKTTYSEDGISMDNVYYDNVMHICVYEGKKSLFASDVTKQMFDKVLPVDFLEQSILSDTKFMKALFNTLKLMVMIVPLQMILSLIVSVFLVSHRHMLIGKIANSVIFIPVLCSNAATGVIWRELLNGKIPAVETFFGLFGIKASMLLGNAKTALAVVAAVAIWKMLGYYVVIYSSGLLGISESFYEAAKVDGAGTVTRFFRITLPMLKPTIILAVFLSITSSLQCFDLIYTMTGGGPNNASTTLVIYAYSLCFAGSSSAGYAMAVSNILFVVILVIAMLQRGMMKREASEI